MCSSRRLAERQVNIRILCQGHWWQWGVPWEIQVRHIHIVCCFMLTLFSCTDFTNSNLHRCFLSLTTCLFLGCCWGFFCQRGRVRHCKCSLQMRKDQGKLHSASGNARLLCWERFTHPGLPLQPVWRTGNKNIHSVCFYFLNFVGVAINTTHTPWTIGCLLNLFPNSLHFECCDLEHWILAYLRYIIKYIYLYYVKIYYLIWKTHFCFSNLDFSCLYDLGARAWCRN